MLRALLHRECGLDLLPAGLGRRQRVVSIPHRQEKAAALPLHLRNARRRLLGQRAFHRIAADVPAAEHQLRLVQGWQIFLRQRLNQRHAGVIEQHHHMRALQRRSAANAHPRRNARENRSLRRAHRRMGAGRKVVLIQVEPAHKPQPLAALRRAPDEDKAICHPLHKRAAGQIARHGLSDARNTRIPL